MNAIDYASSTIETTGAPSSAPGQTADSPVGPAAEIPAVPIDASRPIGDDVPEAPRSQRGTLGAIDRRLFAAACVASFVFGVAGGIVGGTAMVAATGSGSSVGASQPGAMGGGAGQDGGGAPMMNGQGQMDERDAAPEGDGEDADSGGDVDAAVSGGGAVADDADDASGDAGGEGLDAAISVGELLGGQTSGIPEVFSSRIQA